MTPNDDVLTATKPGVAPQTRYRVVDADAHVDTPPEMWADYLPVQYKDRAPRIEMGDAHDWIVFEGNRRPVNLSSNVIGRAPKDYKILGKRSEMRQNWLPEVRLGDMDLDGMDVAVMFGGGPLGSADTDLYIESFSAYNRWLWDWCGADRKRLVPVAYMPTREPAETVALVKEMARLGYRSINIPAFPQSRTAPGGGGGFTAQSLALAGDPTSGRTFADEEWDVLWSVLCDLDISITMHLGGRVPRFGDKKNFLPDMPMSKVAMIEPIAIFIFNAVFQRFPKLRLATIESGVGWMAWVTEYMDRTWEKQRYWMDSPLTEPPSFYMEQNVYASFINDREGILNRDRPGAKNIMWSSDYPHSETTFPNSHDVIARDFVGVPEADVREIVCDRAARFFSIA